MIKFNKDLNSKIISLLIVAIFNFEGIGYSILDSEYNKAILRVPIGSKRVNEALRITKNNVLTVTDSLVDVGKDILHKSTDVDLDSLKKMGLIPDLTFENEKWFKDGHPSQFYHDLNHSFTVAGVAYVSAKIRGLSEKNAKFLYNVGLIHDYDPTRQNNTSARVPSTLELIIKDFNRERSLSGEENASILQDRFGWGKREYLMALCIIQHSEFPFGPSHPNPAYKDISPLERYVELLTQLQQIDQEAVKFVIVEGALFSEYADKSSTFFIGGYSYVLNTIESLVAEINIKAGKQVINFPDFVPQNYETFMLKLGTAENFTYDIQVAHKFGFYDLGFPNMQDVLRLMPRLFALRFTSNLLGFRKYSEVYDKTKANFEDAMRAGQLAFEGAFYSYSASDEIPLHRNITDKSL